jgi:hypothetical protein
MNAVEEGMNELQRYWFEFLVAGIRHELHNHEYTVGYDTYTAEIVLEEIKRGHREACALEPSIPDFDNHTYRRALNLALKTLGTAEEYFASQSALGSEP